MGGTIFSRLRRTAKGLARDQRGNALILTAAAIVPVIGIVGSGVDIGRAYMTQLRLQQACDAGVLAGRRAMAAGTYSEAAQAEANKMFNFNMPASIYGSQNISFSSQAVGKSDVTGTASAKLPTAIMYIFGTDQFNLSVACTAKLEISNVDVMMVLDVTGSMDKTNSGDTVNRISALRTATMDFFDTLTTAEIGDGRLRFGVVPYSSSANVGAILYAKNPAWLADSVRLPSRQPVTKDVWGDATYVESDDYTETTHLPDGGTNNPSWNNTGEYGNANSKSKCEALAIPEDDRLKMIKTTNGTADVEVDGSTRISVYDSERTYEYYKYRYSWSSSKGCRLQQLRMTFRRTYEVTKTETLTKVFDNKYTYLDRVFPVAEVKNRTTALLSNVGDSGQQQSNLWSGCVLERATTSFGADETAPSDARDMDVDSAPTDDDVTKWRLLIPEIAFARASHPSYQPSTSGSKEVNSNDVTSNSYSKGSWQNYSKYSADGWGVCPAAAMNLTTMTKADRATFNNYVNLLQPIGGTYHDAGMVWGVRLLSPTGLFKAENAVAPNGRPISRHIVFMTDGEMAPNMGNLSFQGYEYLEHRVGGTDDAELARRHTNRFLQLCRAARERGITVWVVSFGVGANAQLDSCSTSGKAYESANSKALNDNFQSIARQISKLRLSQ